MQTTFSVLFYPRRNDIDKFDNAPIYLRITVDGKRSEFSIKRKVTIEKWNSEAGKARGTSTETRELNRYMDTIRGNIYRIHDHLVDKQELITADKIKRIYQGKTKKHKMLLEIFQNHNDKIERLVGKEFAPGSIERYKTAKKHVTDYIELEYKVTDIPVKDVDHKFITGLEYYLKTERNCAHNTAIKYVVNFKKIIRIAFMNDWIAKDPFIHWKAKLKIVDRVFLTEGEIQRMYSSGLFLGEHNLY